MTEDSKKDDVEVEGSPYRLVKPITFEGTEIAEIEYDFDLLTGKDLIKAERQMGDAMVSIPALSMEYQSLVFATAAKKPIELIHALKGPDFSEVCARALVFLSSRA